VNGVEGYSSSAELLCLNGRMQFLDPNSTNERISWEHAFWRMELIFF